MSELTKDQCAECIHLVNGNCSRGHEVLPDDDWHCAAQSFPTSVALYYEIKRVNALLKDHETGVNRLGSKEEGRLRKRLIDLELGLL